MNLAALCLDNNRTATVLFVLIALSGVWSYMSMPRLEDPTFTVRRAVVVTAYPGATPEKVERLVTDKLEDKIRDMGEVKTITSQSMSGLSVIHVQVGDQYTDMQPIWQRLRNKVRDTVPDLPQGARKPVVNDEFGDVYGILLCLTGKDYTYKDLKEMADRIRDQLLDIREVAKVVVHGEQEERIYVQFSNARLADFGLSPRQLMGLLQGQNALQPSGEASVGPERLVMETTGEFSGLSQLRQTLLTIPGRETPVKLKDVASVTRGYVDPPQEMVRFNGQKTILLAVSMVDDGNILDLGRRIKDKVHVLHSSQPVGMDLNIFMFQPKYVQRAISDFTRNLLEAFGFVIAVMFVFVGLRTGIVAGLLVPMAMLGAVASMRLIGVKLQVVSIGALIISLGILVDNAVVVSEYILVQMGRGMNKRQAVIQAVHRLWLPLLTASLTTIVVFLPIPLAQSDTGEYTCSLFTVVALTLSMSWLLSMSLVPLLSQAFLRPKSGSGGGKGQVLLREYERLLAACLRWRWSFILGVLVLIGVAVWGFGFVPKMFFPPNEREIVVLDFWQPYGVGLETTKKRVEVLENWLLKRREVRSVGTFVGYGGPRWYLAMEPEQFKPNYAFCAVNTRTVAGAKRLRAAIEAEIANRFPDTRASVRLLERGPPVGAPIQIRLSGKDWDTLYALRDRIAGELANTEGISSVWDDWGEWTKKLVLDVDQQQAKQAGISSRDIALSLQGYFSGIQVSEYRQEDDLIPIVFRAEKRGLQGVGGIDGVHVFSSSRQVSVPLRQVATPKLEWQPGNIRHRDSRRTLTVKADLEPGYFASSILHHKVMPALKHMQGSTDWPWGYDIAYGGEFEESARANRSILVNVPLAFGLIAFILVLQFNSIRRVGIIVLTLPPAIIGVTAGMLLTNSPFGFMAMLGMISLVGIIVNNAIMMVDQIEIERQKLGNQDLAVSALLKAARTRLRPICMTACTTILGLVPLSLQGGQLWRPMANVLISGLAFSTLLTLFLCPVLYALIFGLRRAD